ncbi:MAG: 1,4-alpha-glucan branching protein GlgB [bacterium]|nr:1,4-alpha-glucan branching protein GlgB [bacterium]
MDDALYNVMNWPQIEAIVYSEHDNPHDILGYSKIEEGYLINAFFPTATSVQVVLKDGKKYTMELTDEAGFYSVIVPRRNKPEYKYVVNYDNGTEQEVVDPYNFKPVITARDMDMFSKGVHYTVYEKLGAHPMTINGVEGVAFAVWAPNAIRVSVVGDFNIWDGRRHPMRRLGDSGIFELFIPGVKEGEVYKYELKVKGGLTFLKSDPYGCRSELRPATASIVCNINKHQWNDEKWLQERKRKNAAKEPMSIYEVHLGSWRKPDIEGDNAFYNYREIAPMLAEYVLDMGYTHVELMPVMEHPLDASWGYQVIGYYSVTSRFGTPDDFMYFMDYLHQKGIGVILDWVPAHFPRDTHGLSNFDGTCLYEHQDPRQGSHPHWGTLIYNYGRPQVANFLIANALFWVEKFHADGIRMDAVASMLYLDYGKEDGEWVANAYGGNENLDAIALFKHLNTVFKKRGKGAVIMAEESTAWPMVTKSVEEDGLGFDFKWNMGWMNDFLDYMKTDPLFRKGRQGELTFSLSYAFSEKYVLVLSHDEVVHGKGSMINKMPGDFKQKFENLRVAYGFMMAHPGKKLLFMGQDFAQFSEWSEMKSLEWNLLDVAEHRQMHDYVRALNKFYRSHPALYSTDSNVDGFEWISSLDADHSVISFVRKSADKKEKLLFVFNFTPVEYDTFKVGVPFDGRFKEIFNSDDEKFGGENHLNNRSKKSQDIPWDGRENSIEITLPPLGMAVFSCKSAEEIAKEKANTKQPARIGQHGRRATRSSKAVNVDQVVAKGNVEPEMEKKEVEKQEKVAVSSVKVQNASQENAKAESAASTVTQQPAKKARPKKPSTNKKPREVKSASSVTAASSEKEKKQEEASKAVSAETIEEFTVTKDAEASKVAEVIDLTSARK